VLTLILCDITSCNRIVSSFLFSTVTRVLFFLFNFIYSQRYRSAFLRVPTIGCERSAAVRNSFSRIRLKRHHPSTARISVRLFVVLVLLVVVVRSDTSDRRVLMVRIFVLNRWYVRCFRRFVEK